jgi:hypothetical protein
VGGHHRRGLNVSAEQPHVTRWQRTEACVTHKHFDKALLGTMIIFALYAPAFVRWLVVQLVGPEDAWSFLLLVWWLGALVSVLAGVGGYRYVRRRPEHGIASPRADRIIVGVAVLAVAMSCVPLALLVISS